MPTRKASLELVTLVVDDYDLALEFFVGVLDFQLLEDQPALTNAGAPKRWVVVSPGGQTGLLLAQADGEEQRKIIGAQVAGRVGFFLRVDDFAATYERLCAAGVVFTTSPRTEPYGTVAVFQDVAGNKWDLLGPRPTDPTAFVEPAPIAIVGRSSSHFTRVARIFALELGVPYELEVVPDLMSTESTAYGGNPSLKVPSLRTSSGTWYGALNVCRELARRSPLRRTVLWPEDLRGALGANAQELVFTAMSTSVGIILSKLGRTDTTAPESGGERKMRASLEQTLEWLESHANEVLVDLPARDLSLLEVSLFCLIEHLTFREVLDTTRYRNLRAFSKTFGSRASARHTEFHFDV